MMRVWVVCLRCGASLGIWFGFAVWAVALQAADPEKPSARRVDRSAHILLHSDLPQDEANQLLQRMEETLRQTCDYWRRPVRGLIECYIIDDFKNWPDDKLPHPMARLVVDRIGGITLVDNVGAGIHTRTKVLIVAASRHGVAEHEAVHAYCGSVFGVTGPAWYREGMAQVFAYAPQGEEGGLHCPQEVIADLTGGQSIAIHDVVQGGASSRKLANSLMRKVDQRQNVVGLIPVSDWSESDVRDFDNLRREYAWSWLACHLLFHNPNYQARFKSLGQGYLANCQDRFGELFGPVMDQLSFEYEFTVRHFTPGYRVDLCHWDWNKRFRTVCGGRPVRVRVLARRGYQASGLQVNRGLTYQVQTSGSWKTNARHATGAAGGPQGRGRLEGVVLNNYRLSRPIDIGDTGEFLSPCDGQLYLRCRDDWAQLGDNEGSIVVALRHAR